MSDSLGYPFFTRYEEKGVIVNIEYRNGEPYEVARDERAAIVHKRKLDGSIEDGLEIGNQEGER